MFYSEGECFHVVNDEADSHTCSCSSLFVNECVFSRHGKSSKDTVIECWLCVCVQCSCVLCMCVFSNRMFANIDSLRTQFLNRIQRTVLKLSGHETEGPGISKLFSETRIFSVSIK